MSVITSACNTEYLEEIIWISSLFAQKLQFKQAEEYQAYFGMVHNVASLAAAQKRDDFLLPGAKSFPMVYNMDGFAAINFRRYYTSMTYILPNLTV